MAVEIGGSWVDGSLIYPALGFRVAISERVDTRSIVVARRDMIKSIGASHVSAKEWATDTVGLDALEHEQIGRRHRT